MTLVGCSFSEPISRGHADLVALTMDTRLIDTSESLLAKLSVNRALYVWTIVETSTRLHNQCRSGGAEIS